MPAKVLVADDSPTIRRRATTTLSEAGYEVTCVEDGQAAWNLLQEPQTFSVLLCDILMPGLDGYELCRRVKSDGRLSSLPVLLLRGTFEPWDQGKAVDAGADGYVTKPFDAEALLSTLGEVLADTGGASVPVAAAAPAAAPAAPPLGGGTEAPPAPEPMPAASAAPLAPVAEPQATAPEAASADAPFGEGALGEAEAPAAAAASANPFDMDAEPAPVDTLVFDPGAPSTADEPLAALGEEPPPFGGAASAAEPLPPHEPPEPWALAERDPVAPPAPAPPPPPLPATPLEVKAAPFAERPAPAPAPPAAAAAAAPAAATMLDEAMIEMIADRVAARLVGRDLEKIAWEVVPDVAEALIRKRLSEIEAQLGEE